MGTELFISLHKVQATVKFFISQVLFLLAEFLIYSCISPLHFYLCLFIQKLMLSNGGWSPIYFLDLSIVLLLVLSVLHWIKSPAVWTLTCGTRSYIEISVAPGSLINVYTCPDSFLSNLKVVGKEKYPILVQSSPGQGNLMFKKDLESQIIACYSFPTQMVARSFVTLEILSLLKE